MIILMIMMIIIIVIKKISDINVTNSFDRLSLKLRVYKRKCKVQLSGQQPEELINTKFLI